ncbi:transcriptional regulator [Plantactinospora sp. KBS50]|nr:transcriptional regulator [Plantactinospora sp. KBS50]
MVAYVGSVDDDDAVFRALADPTRRRLLDSLYARNGQMLSELCAQVGTTRQAVSKHLAMLEEARLVVTLRRGREKRHYLNPAPILDLAGRWIHKYESRRLFALAELKRHLEEESHG